MKPLRSSLSLALLLGACAPAAQVVSAPSPITPPAGMPAPSASAPDVPRAPGDTSPANWWLLDEATDHWGGISAEKAYRELLAGMQPRRQIVVAVIDGGADLEHPDLKAKAWTNPREVPGNGRDDDGDGYVDDVHGWNFIGGRDGRNVNEDSYEVTRVYAAGRARFEGANADTTSPGVQADFATWKRARAELMSKRSENQETLNSYRQIAANLAAVQLILRGPAHADSLNKDNVTRIISTDTRVQEARKYFLNAWNAGATPAAVAEAIESVENGLKYGYNPEFDPRPVVGDNYANWHEKLYGNGDFRGPAADHGTHVAGIVGAVRGNGIGVNGVTPNTVRIMSVRVVPDGDERDKDVANGIRWAVDHGANVINMSFGKGYSPQKLAVDSAAAYADAHGVLLIHAAGNDGGQLDTLPNFPKRTWLSGASARNWVEVGATSWKGADSLVATFSNYEKTQVDLFAPGVDILSTFPDGKYERISGTSMAAPVVTGVAATVWSYYPDLTVDQLKQILLASATRHVDQQVVVPNVEGRRRFGDLSATGGIVNLYAALQMARQMSQAH
ncbi:MAG TPA: S8 family serine peptidase [Longimicrobiaceae bacterium]|nr:S8 family serine peptidase [Longimicrobiaceae bacterium]